VDLSSKSILFLILEEKKEKGKGKLGEDGTAELQSHRDRSLRRPDDGGRRTELQNLRDQSLSKDRDQRSEPQKRHGRQRSDPQRSTLRSWLNTGGQGDRLSN